MAIREVKLHGIKELHRALKRYNAELAKQLDEELLDAGRIVEREARERFSAIDAYSAAGFKSKTKGFGRVVVEQSRRRKTGQRPDFGSLQMRRGLIPARSASEPRVMEAVESMLDRLGREEGF